MHFQLFQLKREMAKHISWLLAEGTSKTSYYKFKVKNWTWRYKLLMYRWQISGNKMCIFKWDEERLIEIQWTCTYQKRKEKRKTMNVTVILKRIMNCNWLASPLCFLVALILVLSSHFNLQGFGSSSSLQWLGPAFSSWSPLLNFIDQAWSLTSSFDVEA